MILDLYNTERKIAVMTALECYLYEIDVQKLNFHSTQRLANACREILKEISSRSK